MNLYYFLDFWKNIYNFLFSINIDEYIYWLFYFKKENQILTIFNFRKLIFRFVKININSFLFF